MIPLQIHSDIEGIRIQRRNLEVEVARALNGFFKKNYIYSIQRLCRKLLLEILSVEEGALDRFLNEQSRKFLMFQTGVHATTYGLQQFLRRELWWTLENCSDIIRLFGECVEVNKNRMKQLNPAFEDFYLNHLKKKDMLRPPPIFLKKGDTEGGFGPEMYHRDRSEPATRSQLEKAMQMPEGNPKEKAMERLMVPGDIISPLWKDRLIPFSQLKPKAEWQQEALMRAARRESLAKQESDRPENLYTNIGSIVRGVDKFRFEPKSVIAAINRTFGLRPEGADISGTTTDSLYALNWAGGVAHVSNEVLGIIQLLPLVTMVPQGHHTIVECAWPLTRHKQKDGSTYLDYHVGYYSTLAPMNAGAAAHGRIEGILKDFDADERNKHILVWGRGAGEQGVWMSTEEEIAAFKKAANVRSAYAFCVAGGLHDFEEALNIMKTYSPDLLAPRLEALRGQVGLSELERRFRTPGMGLKPTGR
ncbi:MAG: hypothetical protein JXA73_16925 [Acidobacteria bacterium]|nr:hypothetical protein [Acidobacteriota bacterium]